MIRKLVFEDFMAHGHTELELGPGLTVLTGPNNTGKSALVEGLRCLATNPPPKPYIRHGAKLARVEVHLDDGEGNLTKVAWVRRKTSAIYELTRPGEEEPEIYAKFGRTPPDDILDALRLDLVALETDPNNPVDVHIGNQREPIFLINRPSSAAAAFFATSSESAHLLAMQDRLKDRTREARREEKQLEARLTGLEADLDQLAGLPDIALAVEDLAGREAAIQAQAQALPGLENLGNRLSALNKALDRTQGRKEALARLAPPGSLHPAGQLAHTLERGRMLDRERNRLSQRLAPLADLQPPPRTLPTAGLADMITQMHRLRSYEDGLRKWQKPLANLQLSPTIENTAPAARILERMQALETQRTRLRERLDGLARQRTDLEREISERVQGRVCPLCNSRIETGVFMGEGAPGQIEATRASQGHPTPGQPDPTKPDPRQPDPKQPDPTQADLTLADQQQTSLSQATPDQADPHLADPHGDAEEGRS